MEPAEEAIYLESKDPQRLQEIGNELLKDGLAMAMSRVGFICSYVLGKIPADDKSQLFEQWVERLITFKLMEQRRRLEVKELH